MILKIRSQSRSENAQIKQTRSAGIVAIFAEKIVTRCIFPPHSAVISSIWPWFLTIWPWFPMFFCEVITRKNIVKEMEFIMGARANGVHPCEFEFDRKSLAIARDFWRQTHSSELRSAQAPKMDFLYPYLLICAFCDWLHSMQEGKVGRYGGRKVECRNGFMSWWCSHLQNVRIVSLFKARNKIGQTWLTGISYTNSLIYLTSVLQKYHKCCQVCQSGFLMYWHGWKQLVDYRLCVVWSV